jgi:urease accessory protein
MNNMKINFLSGLLHLADPTLPIGGYTHSNGLETYVQERIVHNVETAKEFVQNMLQYNLKFNDGLLQNWLIKQQKKKICRH